MSPLGLLLLAVLPLLPVRGHVRDAVTRAPLAGVTVQVVGSTTGTSTDASGAYALSVPDGRRLRFTRSGYTSLEATPGDSVLDVLLVPSVRSLEGVTVTALRAEGARPGGAPISQRIVTQEEIERRYSGQEMPLLLTATPSVTAYSDGGAFSNYTYMRLRGIDQTRINITLDGVPLNDQEDQGVFFSNLPDFGTSVQSVQIQRGVGTSSQGTASYAGSVNFESIALANGPRRGELQLSRGAFNTTRGSAEWQSGLLPNKFAFYGRVSALDTDGYRHHSGNKSQGGFVSAGYFGERTSAKLTLISGVSRNQESYLASSIEALRADPRDNPLTKEERDRFTQTVISASATHLVGAHSTASATAYSLLEGGDYDVRIGEELWNFNLESRVVGAFTTWNYQRGALTLNTGVHGNTYYRDHFLFIRPNLRDRIYSNTGEKDEASAFVKTSYDVGRVTLFGDAQVRHVWYRYLPDAQAGISKASTDWSFFNPKIGVTYLARPSLSFYASIGTNGREPTRNDMFAGFDNVDTTNADFVGPLSRVRPERVRDVEAGVSWRARALDVRANVFAMSFHNEITPIGELSYIGLPLRKNVASSYRRGVEVDALYRGFSRIVLGTNLTWSHNRIAEYTDDAAQQTYRDVTPLLTPAVITNQSAELQLTDMVTVGLDGRYVSRSFLSNTGDSRFVTPPFYMADATLSWRIGTYTLLAQLRNIADREIFTGGYTDGVTSYYYPMARRNLIVTVRAAF
jgi:iron complex outermembrane recepter protein